MMAHIVNAETGEVTVRELTPQEQQRAEADLAAQQAQADAEAAVVAARQSAINKLAALGLTVDEISAAFGLGDN